MAAEVLERHEGTDLLQRWNRLMRECGTLQGHGSDVKVFKNRPDYGQFEALTLSAGFNNTTFNIHNENFKIGHGTQKDQCCGIDWCMHIRKSEVQER
jgi:hypothetical protein